MVQDHPVPAIAAPLEDIRRHDSPRRVPSVDSLDACDDPESARSLAGVALE